MTTIQLLKDKAIAYVKQNIQDAREMGDVRIDNEMIRKALGLKANLARWDVPRKAYVPDGKGGYCRVRGPSPVLPWTGQRPKKGDSEPVRRNEAQADDCKVPDSQPQIPVSGRADSRH